MADTARIDGYIELEGKGVLERLYDKARAIDANLGYEGYVYRGPAYAIAAVLNGGTVEEIAELFALILEDKGGWSFSPEGGW